MDGAEHDGAMGNARASAECQSEPPVPERASERLAEDEALRRDLDDATFGPLLDLCASLAVARAERYRDDRRALSVRCGPSSPERRSTLGAARPPACSRVWRAADRRRGERDLVRALCCWVDRRYRAIDLVPIGRSSGRARGDGVQS